MRKKIIKDFHHICQIDSGVVSGNFLKTIRNLANCYGLQVIITFRLFQFVKKSENVMFTAFRASILLIVSILHKFLERMYDIHISLDAEIGAGLYIGHFGGIRIGKCKIGKFCNINHQVRIGTMKQTRSGDLVAIGDYVWIGAHSVILKGVTIHSRATISAGTRVFRDVLEGSLVMGPSCRVLQKQYDNNHLLGYSQNEGLIMNH